jgi:hypothetical protein
VWWRDDGAGGCGWNFGKSRGEEIRRRDRREAKEIENEIKEEEGGKRREIAGDRRIGRERAVIWGRAWLSVDEFGGIRLGG